MSSKTDFGLMMCFAGKVFTERSVGGDGDSLPPEVEPLKQPEDIIEAVDRCKRSGDHTEIHSILRDRKINLSKLVR